MFYEILATVLELKIFSSRKLMSIRDCGGDVNRTNECVGKNDVFPVFHFVTQNSVFFY